MDPPPRVRMFAGPNGSGKSTLKDDLQLGWLGTYLNPDDIQRDITKIGLDLAPFPIDISQAEIDTFWLTSSILPSTERSNVPSLADGRIKLNAAEAGYGAAALADLLRRKLFAARKSFSFETVMSHASKIDFLRAAQRVGYRTYLYFICTDDPAINIARVQERVSAGGHSVEEAKIRERYYRCLELLPAAIQASNRAYLFDNSRENEDKVWIAEFTDGESVTFKVDERDLPGWFRNSAGVELIERV